MLVFGPEPVVPLPPWTLAPLRGGESRPVDPQYVPGRLGLHRPCLSPVGSQRSAFAPRPPPLPLRATPAPAGKQTSAVRRRLPARQPLHARATQRLACPAHPASLKRLASLCRRLPASVLRRPLYAPFHRFGWKWKKTGHVSGVKGVLGVALRANSATCLPHPGWEGGLLGRRAALTNSIHRARGCGLSQPGRLWERSMQVGEQGDAGGAG